MLSLKFNVNFKSGERKSAGQTGWQLGVCKVILYNNLISLFIRSIYKWTLTSKGLLPQKRINFETTRNQFRDMKHTTWWNSAHIKNQLSINIHWLESTSKLKESLTWNNIRKKLIHETGWPSWSSSIKLGGVQGVWSNFSSPNLSRNGQQGTSLKRGLILHFMIQVFCWISTNIA